VLQVRSGNLDDGVSERLERAYYALQATPARHFGQEADGWFLTGVEGLDPPSLNRAVVTSAAAAAADEVRQAAERFFRPRDARWSITLATFRAWEDWHANLVGGSMLFDSRLNVMVRATRDAVSAPSDIAVRRVEVDEITDYTQLLLDIFRMPGRFLLPLRDMTAAWIDAGATAYYGLDEADEPVATAMVTHTDGVAGVYNVGVLRHARRRGYARALMAALIDEASEDDFVTLQVGPDDFVEHFYQRLGFVQAYEWRFYTPRPKWSLFG